MPARRGRVGFRAKSHGRKAEQPRPRRPALTPRDLRAAGPIGMGKQKKKLGPVCLHHVKV
jgi:hypothetical protein